jgi:type II secretory pathway component PulJ
MNLIELLISSLLGSIILMGIIQSGYQLHQSIHGHLTRVTLHNEGLQAIQMMGQAIQTASPPKGATLFKLMAKDSSAMSNSQVGQFQVRKGSASLDGSDAFYTHHIDEAHGYQAFFVQHQGHYQQREGVLYLQTKNKKGHLQNDALIGHVQSMQIQAGIKNNQSIEWHDPYELSERVTKNHPHWKQVRALKIRIKLHKNKHALEIEKIFALRHPR